MLPTFDVKKFRTHALYARGMKPRKKRPVVRVIKRKYHYA